MLSTDVGEKFEMLLPASLLPLSNIFSITYHPRIFFESFVVVNYYRTATFDGLIMPKELPTTIRVPESDF